MHIRPFPTRQDAAVELVVYASGEEWLDARRRLITATDASAILGHNPYKTADDVLRHKRNLVDRLPRVGDGRAMWAGTHLESAVLAMAYDTLKVQPVDLPSHCIVRRVDLPCLGFSPDGIVLDRQGYACPVEAKTAGSDRKWGAPVEMVPPWYVDQVLYQAAILEAPQAWVAAIVQNVYNFRTWHYPLLGNDRLSMRAARLVAAAATWWDRHGLGR